MILLWSVTKCRVYECSKIYFRIIWLKIDLFSYDLITKLTLFIKDGLKIRISKRVNWTRHSMHRSKFFSFPNKNLNINFINLCSFLCFCLVVCFFFNLSVQWLCFECANATQSQQWLNQTPIQLTIEELWRR